MKLSAKSFTLLATICLLAFAVCKTPTEISREYGSYGFATQCIGTDPDGNQILRTWGNGISKAKAIEQAKRKAVETVILKGINDGAGGCDRRPLVNEVNAREKYEEYFNAFFREGGAYNKYVTLEEKRTSRIKSQNAEMEAWSVVVIVKLPQLKQRLIDDNMISK